MVASSADGSGHSGGDQQSRTEVTLASYASAWNAGYLNRPMPDAAKFNVRLMRAYGEGQDAFEEEKEYEYEQSRAGEVSDPCGCIPTKNDIRKYGADVE